MQLAVSHSMHTTIYTVSKQYCQSVCIELCTLYVPHSANQHVFNCIYFI